MALALCRGELLGGEGEGCFKSSTFLDAVSAEIFIPSRFAHRLPYGFQISM
jgi:hypothetical protein